MNDDDIPQVLMPDYEEKIKNILLNTELNIHGYGYKQLIEGSIRDNSFTMSRYRRFETKTQTWIKQNYPTYRNQSRLINVLLLNEDLWQASENKLLQFLSNDTNNNNKEYYTFYHGCLEYAAHSICLNDLGLHWNYPKGTDFGPGVYVTRNLFDALCVAKRRSLYQPSSSKFDEEQNRPACIIFQCPKEEFDTFSILKLEVNNLDLSADRQPLISQDIEENEIFKWDKFVHLCHDQRYPLPLVKSYDGIEGHICNNIRQVQAGIHGPKSQLNSWQLCVQSVRFAEKFTSWISGIILLQLPS
ncbi:unnamed protein product [Rotaria sp. Silwood2]|nr:unnamed protein product [Rotaria sp. Silwood2]CAF2575078.1 unnamed protein product [Rotaria sp. Silwood2]CAF3441501.1 unnamed protein product [Rotaria sp. Silwood2]CAF4562811.1 unnamed protein product [Rotaria sp. Silwood2]